MQWRGSDSALRSPVSLPAVGVAEIAVQEIKLLRVVRIDITTIHSEAEQCTWQRPVETHLCSSSSISLVASVNGANNIQIGFAGDNLLSRLLASRCRILRDVEARVLRFEVVPVNSAALHPLLGRELTRQRH